MDPLILLVTVVVGLIVSHLGVWAMTSARCQLKEEAWDAMRGFLVERIEELNNRLSDFEHAARVERAAHDEQVKILQSLLLTAREEGYEPGHTGLFLENESYRMEDYEVVEGGEDLVGEVAAAAIEEIRETLPPEEYQEPE